MKSSVQAQSTRFPIARNSPIVTTYNNVYRIRIGSRRAFFTFHIEVVNDNVFFRYLVSRGQAYDKTMEKALSKADKE